MVLLDFVENSRAHRSIRSEERWINWTYIQRSCKALSRSFLRACSRWPWVSSYDEEKGIVVIVLHAFLFAGCIFYGKSLWLGSVWLPNQTVDTTSWGIKVPYNSENHDSASCLLATCFSSYRNFKNSTWGNVGLHQEVLILPPNSNVLFTTNFCITCMEFCGAEQPDMVLS